MELVYKHFDKILNIVAVIIGGIISFVATTRIEEKKYKRQQQKENLNNILIPFCTSVEDTVEKFEKNEERQIYLKNSLEEWKLPLEYLIASKRVFLTKQLKKLLAEYEDLLKKFEDNLEKEYKDFLTKYKEYIVNKVIDYNSSSMNVFIGLDGKTEFMIKTLVLYKNYKFSFKDNIDEIEFVYNDDPENYRNFIFNLSNSNREFYGAVSCGVSDINDAEDDIEKETYYLLDYLYGIKDEKEVVMEIIKNYSSDKLLNEIKEVLAKIMKISLKEIDNIA